MGVPSKMNPMDGHPCKQECRILANQMTYVISTEIAEGKKAYSRALSEQDRHKNEHSGISGFSDLFCFDRKEGILYGDD